MEADTLDKMPADSVAMTAPPLGRWYNGSVYSYDDNNGTGVWRKIADYPESQLDDMQKLMLQRTRDRNFPIRVMTWHNKVVYEGGWEGAPEPVADYISSAQQHYGPGTKKYLQTKSLPVALLMQGYGIEVL